jgi:phage host-nuclease inhibitor protein Gam
MAKPTKKQLEEALRRIAKMRGGTAFEPWQLLFVFDAFEKIEDLQEEVKRLRHEMERIADVSERWPDSLVSQINEIARAALKEGE